MRILTWMTPFIAMFSVTLANADDFSGPLFGMATAPNGDILVADVTAGVYVDDGDPYLMNAVPGLTDISAIGRGSLWGSKTWSGPGIAGEPAVLRISNGRVRTLANLWEFELANNPHPGPPESNPFDIQALGGEAALVVDAAANDLLWVDDEGHVEWLAVFPDALASTDNLKNLLGCPESGAPLCALPPSIPAQPVPTSVAIGPDGWYYVGELKGFPAPVNESRIWRVAPWAHQAQCGSSPDCQLVFDGGFTSIIDLAFGPDGLLYVVEFDEASWFAIEVLGIVTGSTINACDVSALNCYEVAGGIPIVSAITFDKDGSLWATQNALIPGLADVVQIP